MRTAGDTAPGFELPAVVGEDLQRQSLSEYLGDDVVVLAFYPADFNPACDEDGCDLGELDLFTMQKDVTILGISPDSVYSHRQFADFYDLKVPLLSDTRREVAEEYGVALEGEQGYLIKRAVFVVDLHGTIQYAWATADPHELPTIEPIRAAISAVGGDSTAVSRYKVGHAHYVEGRRAFTSAMNAYGDHEWMTARKDFARAREEFEEAADEFDTALRFSDAAALDGPFEQARLKSNSLWQAADWLADSADAYSSGNGAVGEEYRQDAETPLTSARNLDEPLDPDYIVVEDGEVTVDTDEEESIMHAIREQQGSEETEEAAGGVDLTVEDVDPEPAEKGDDEERTPETEAARRAREYGGMDVEMGESGGADEDQIADAVNEVAPEDIEAADEEDVDLEEDVTDEEVAEIAAEIEQQSDEAGTDEEDDEDEDEEDVTDEEVAEIAAELERQDEQ